jgi:HK97 family phage major capsid protein
VLTAEQLLEKIHELQDRAAKGEDVGGDLDAAEAALKVLKEHRQGSRFAGPGASADVAAHLARGGAIAGDGTRIDPKEPGAIQGRTADMPSGQFLADLVYAKAGDVEAAKRLSQIGKIGTKGWVEGTPSAGGYLVAPEQLPGYLEKRRASAPLRDRCTQRTVTSDEVWVVTEENTVTVQHVAEAATIPTSTGSVGQKVVTNFKAAGETKVSSELLEDTNGNAGDLVGSQFAKQVGITQDTAILSGSGVGQPTGIRNAVGVNAQAVDGQGGQALYNSIVKALSRIRQRFWTPDTVAVQGRDLVKFDLALDSQNRYLFESGLAGALNPGMVVEDPNIPTNLGGGTNETVIIVGDFKNGAFFFERSPFGIKASEHAGWQTDEVSFKGRERYGFAVVRPECFEILTGITP